MSKVKIGFIGICSAVITLLVAFFNYRGLENFSGIVRLVSIVSSALVIGICQGFFVQRSDHRALGMGAFFGLLILWSPVVMVTYGFALMALPLLAAFAMLVFFGAKVGANLRLSSCWSA
jgi:amino acid transporter